MLGDAAQGFGADVAFADVPVTVDAGVVNGARIVEVNGANALQTDCLLNSLQQRIEPVRVANVVTSGERVRRVETNPERQLRTRVHDLAEMFEAVTDAVALSGGVFEQDAQRTEFQTLARDLQARCTQRDAVRFTRA